MWATTPQFNLQPAVEFVPDQPQRAYLPGYIRSNKLGITCSINPDVSDGPPITLESAVQYIHAVHVVLGMHSQPDFSFCLGERYRLTISTFSNADPLHPFMSVGEAAVRARIEDNSAPVASADLPYIPATPVWDEVNLTSGLCACFGYARDNTGQLQAYANISYFGVGAHCGSGTVNLIAPVNEESALQGKMKIVVRKGFVGFHVMACKIGPFANTEHHVLETTYSKTTRAGDRVASLRSNSSNFSSPANFFSTVAQVDCGGHAEFLQSFLLSYPYGYVDGPGNLCLFTPSLAGQPNSETAYVACSNSWRSNCGFSFAHALKTSAISVQVTDWDLHPGFPVRTATFQKSNIVSNLYGNNEYAATVSDDAQFWDTLHVAARITGLEDVVDPFASPLSAVQPRTRFTVSVNVFGSKDGQRSIGFFGFGLVASATKTLTESEAIAFFEGAPLSLVDGKVSITAVGA